MLLPPWEELIQHERKDMLTHKKLERILHVVMMMMILAGVIFALGEILVRAIEYDDCCVTIN